MYFLNDIAAGFVALSLFTLLFLVLGFLLAETMDEDGAEKAPSQLILWRHAVIASLGGLMFAWWGYTDYLEGASDWYWIAACVVAGGVQFWLSSKLARQAFRKRRRA